jgi:hypothetical protein
MTYFARKIVKKTSYTSSPVHSFTGTYMKKLFCGSTFQSSGLMKMSGKEINFNGHKLTSSGYGSI